MSSLPGIGSHQSARRKTDDRLTPRWLIDALGPFDLDPCAAVEDRYRCARQGFTIEDDGLLHGWGGHVWLNPPYSDIDQWMARMAAHERSGPQPGIALVFARTETLWWWDHIWKRATSVLFLRRRLTFERADGLHARADLGRAGGGSNAGAPSALCAYGDFMSARLRDSTVEGAWVDLTKGKYR